MLPGQLVPSSRLKTSSGGSASADSSGGLHTADAEPEKVVRHGGGRGAAAFGRSAFRLSRLLKTFNVSPWTERNPLILWNRPACG